jgi:hypothetical protein
MLNRLFREDLMQTNIATSDFRFNPQPPSLPTVVSERMRSQLRRLLAKNSIFALHDQASPKRDELQQYVYDCFRRAYAADIAEFAPLLLELRCAERTSGVVGIRAAGQHSLFSEQYLDAPIERVVSDFTGQSVQRSQILEIASLAALRPGACQLINIMLVASAHAAGFRYGCFASTSQLQRILQKQHFSVATLAAAEPECLGDDAARWGSYYETEPRVLLVDIEASFQALQNQYLSAAFLELYAPLVRETSLQLMMATTKLPGE